MAKTDYKTIDAYHKDFEGDAVARMQTIRELIHQLAPEVHEVISYQIPAFKLGEKNYLIYYAAFPKHLSISSPWSDAFLKKFEKELKDYKVSKSVIQFPHDQALPINLIKSILKFRKSELEAKKKK